MPEGGDALSVLKFGSSVLGRPEDYAEAAREVGAEVAGGCKVVAVVSAMAGTTDALLAAAERVVPAPGDPELNFVLASGEEMSAGMLALALAARGVSARAFTRSDAPIHTRGPLDNADPIGVEAEPIRSHLESGDVVVYPGFVGIDATGEPSLLGRGGSDMTAIFLGHRFGARELRLVKDVNGICAADPRERPDAVPMDYLGWEVARRIGGGVVQEKALAYAMRHRVSFRVASLGGGRGTWVGRPAEATQPPAALAG